MCWALSVKVINWTNMNKNKLIQYGSITAIVISVIISGYIILKPTSQSGSQAQNASGLAPMVDGKQVIKTTVMAVSYNPSNFKVKAGVPVRMEVTSSGQPGCGAGAVVSKLFPDGYMYLNPTAGQVAMKEFTPQSPGRYTFSCPMGMIRGTIEVIN